MCIVNFIKDLQIRTNWGTNTIKCKEIGEGEWVQVSLGELCLSRDEVQGWNSLQAWSPADLAPQMAPRMHWMAERSNEKYRKILKI